MRRLATILVCALVSLAVVGVAPGADARAPGAEAAVGQGVVQWRFQVSGQYILHPPAVGPDGGVVVVSSIGNVYSLSPAGVLRWVVPSVGGSGGPRSEPTGPRTSPRWAPSPRSTRTAPSDGPSPNPQAAKA